MKLKYSILIFLIVFISANCALAYDSYPEMVMNPLYSSLNPTYINEDETDMQGDSLFDMFKKKDNNKTKENKSFISKFKKKKNSDNSIDLDTSDMTFEDYYDIDTEQSYSRDSNSVEEYTEEDFNRDVENTKNKNRGADLVKEIEKEQKQKELESQGIVYKSFWDKTKHTFRSILPFKKKSVDTPSTPPTNEPQIELSADFMEYYPERYEVEAIGKAKVTFVKQNTVLSANKIIFNYDLNILKAKDNVVLISRDSITEGDFIKLDLNKPEGWMDSPITTNQDIRLTAKEAFLYSDKIVECDGVAKIIKDERLQLGTQSFSGYLNGGMDVLNEQKPIDLSDQHGMFKLKAKTIYIESKKDHEIITIKNADLYAKKFKIASIPSAKIVSNKSHTSMETNLPEFGSMSGLGSHIGPAVVLNVPGGATLKLAPIVTYASSKFGFGGIARYRNEFNMTEMAYGTSKEQFLLRGKHNIAPGLTFNYSRLTNQNEWFLGYRRPKYSAALNYKRSDKIKDLGITFSQLYSAGVYVDDIPNNHIDDAEGRFRWMNQAYKPLYKYVNKEGNIAFGTGLVAQSASTVYTTGDVTGIFRFGPSLQTKVGPWQQSLIYYQTAVAGKAPFEFDRYRYGRSNFVLMENLKVSKYLSLGYLASLAMNREVHDDDMFQESRFLVSIGPEYAKVTIGYDARRNNTMFVFSMLVGTKDSDVEFKRAIIENPSTLGKENKKAKKPKKKNYKKYVRETKPIQVL